MHENMSSASSSSIQFPKGSIGRNEVHGVQDVELQERKIKPAGTKSLKNQFSDKHQIDWSPLSSRSYNATGRYGLRLRRILPWVVKDVKPVIQVKGEDKLQTHHLIQSLKTTFENVKAEIEVEQDEWAKELKNLSHRLNQEDNVV